MHNLHEFNTSLTEGINAVIEENVGNQVNSSEFH